MTYLAATVCAFAVSGCDQLATARFYNLTGGPFTLRVGEDAAAASTYRTNYKIAPGRSQRMIANHAIGATIGITASGCRFTYRPISRSEPGFGTLWDVQHVLDVKPDMAIYLRGRRPSPFAWHPAMQQPPNWPLTPLSKTCD